MLGGKQSSLLLLGKSETDVAVAIGRLRSRLKDFSGAELEMLWSAIHTLEAARMAIRELQPLKPKTRSK